MIEHLSFDSNSVFHMCYKYDYVPMNHPWAFSTNLLHIVLFTATIYHRTTSKATTITQLRSSLIQH